MTERKLFEEENWLGKGNSIARENLEITIPHPPSASKRSLGLTPNSALSSPRAYVPSRPPLLREIEEFLVHNLNPISTDDTLTEDWLSNKRLRVYREAFQRFIDEFNIYKPFLNEVKYEYEATLDFLASRYHSKGIQH